MHKYIQLSLATLLFAGFVTGCASDTSDDEARWQAYKARQEVAQLREDMNRKPKPTAKPQPKPEIFEPVRNTPSTVYDPLYEQN